MELFEYEAELESSGCRDYQKRAIIGAINCWDTSSSTLINLATGLGKTFCGVTICDLWEKHKDGRILWIAHRKELIEQAAATIARLTGQYPETEMGDQRANSYGLLADSNIVVASIQTLNAGYKCSRCEGTGGILTECPDCHGEGEGCQNQLCEQRGTVPSDVDCPFCLGGKVRRVQKFKPSEFGLIVVDECFVRNTDVSGRPIQDIRVGDYVDSFNHDFGINQKRKVLRTFKSQPKSMLRVYFYSGRSFICTPEHPVYAINPQSYGDYIPAAKLLSGQKVVLSTEVIPHGRNTNEKAEGYHEKLSAMRRRSRMLRKRGPRSCQAKQGFLFRAVQAGKGKQRGFGTHGCNKSKIRFRTNETKKSDAQRCVQRQDEGNTKRNRMETACSWRKWNRPNCAAKTIGRRTWNRVGVCNSHWSNPQRPAATTNRIQSGSCLSVQKTRNRNRRPVSRCVVETSTRQKEGGVFAFDWVDRVEVLQQTSDGTFGGMCPDGYVYNIEVEGNNNYYANGVLVHNCHHSSASGYRRVQHWFSKNKESKLLGLTATVDRADGTAIGPIFQTTAISIGLCEGIDLGWLVPITQQAVSCEHMDFSHIRTNRDFNDKNIEEVLIAEETLHEMVAPTVEVAGDRRTLVFCVDKTHTKKVCELINRYKPGSARYVLGCTNEDVRQKNFTDHKNGVFQFLVNCGVTTEGYDDPGIQVVAVMRPTKSRPLYEQMIGRGTRPIVAPTEMTPEERKAAIASGAKTGCLILDFVGNSGRHKLVTTLDLFEGRYPQPLIDRAKRIKEETEEELPTEELLRRAQEQIDEEEKRRKEEAEAKRLEFLKAKEAKYRLESIDPFAWWDVLPQRISAEKRGEPASDAQTGALMKMGVEPFKLQNISKSQASVMLESLAQRKKAGLASYKQARLLRRNGMSADVSFAQARKIIDTLAANNWRMTDAIRSMAPLQGSTEG